MSCKAFPTFKKSASKFFLSEKLIYINISEVRRGVGVWVLCFINSVCSVVRLRHIPHQSLSPYTQRQVRHTLKSQPGLFSETKKIKWIYFHLFPLYEPNLRQRRNVSVIAITCYVWVLCVCSASSQAADCIVSPEICNYFITITQLASPVFIFTPPLGWLKLIYFCRNDELIKL